MTFSSFQTRCIFRSCRSCEPFSLCLINRTSYLLSLFIFLSLYLL
nr:MAG TPA: hypothetical protein [Caudoviricetes sp.]